MSDKLRIGLIGLGNQGMEYLEGQQYCDQLEIVAGCDLNDKQREDVAKKWPDMILAKDHSALGQLDLDGIIMALPHHIYAKIWDSVLEWKLPIMKEKPLGRSLPEARSFVHKARMKHCPLQTAIQRRDHPSYQRLAEELKDKKVSDIILVMNLGFKKSDHDTWRDSKTSSGGGALLDSGYHMVDLALFLVGQFDLLSATLWQDDVLCNPSAGDVEDAMQIIGRQANTWVYIQSRRFLDKNGGSPKREDVIVHTDQGIFSANREGVWEGVPGKGKLIYQCARDWNSAMGSQLDDFAQLIHNKALEYDKYWDQLPAQKIIQQAYQLSANWYGEHHEPH